MTHPEYGRSVNPTSTRGDRLCPPNYYWHTRIFRPSDGPAISLSQPRWADYAHPILVSTPSFESHWHKNTKQKHLTSSMNAPLYLLLMCMKFVHKFPFLVGILVSLYNELFIHIVAEFCNHLLFLKKLLVFISFFCSQS